MNLGRRKPYEGGTIATGSRKVRDVKQDWRQQRIAAQFGDVCAVVVHRFGTQCVSEVPLSIRKMACNTERKVGDVVLA